MNKLDIEYQKLLQEIIHFGVKKEDRTGTGTISLFGKQIRHKMSDGFPLLTTKKMAWKSIVTELLWFLRGDTNIKYLVDNGCHIWDGDAYKNYWINTNKDKYNNLDYLVKQEAGSFSVVRLYYKEEFINKIKTDDEFAKQWGSLGPIYGRQWRMWEQKTWNTNEDGDWSEKINYIDQIANLISELKTNPDSRRLMVSAWAVHDLPKMVLPPCHYGFQVYTRELSYDERFEIFILKNEKKFDWTPDKKITSDVLDELNIPTRAISLMWNQRSVDTFLGLPFNIASYGLLLEIIAKEVNMVPDELIGNLGDVHLYSNHIEQAAEQCCRKPYDLPKLDIKLHFKNEESFNLEHWLIDDFKIENYQSHPAIKAPLSN